HDRFITLCDVDATGRSLNLSIGVKRLTSVPEGVTEVEMWPSAHVFKAGHRLRIQVSSGAHPLYVRNHGTGEPIASATRMVVSEHHVFHDPERPSHLLLPIVKVPPI